VLGPLRSTFDTTPCEIDLSIGAVVSTWDLRGPLFSILTDFLTGPLRSQIDTTPCEIDLSLGAVVSIWDLRGLQ